MATNAEYDAVAAKLEVWLVAEEKKDVPAFLQGMIPSDAAQKAAQAMARIAVDTLDYVRGHK